MVIRRRHVLTIDDGITRVEGYNVGPYPNHHFTFAKDGDPSPAWPLQLRSVGDDEWVQGCLRQRRNARELALELVVNGTFRFVQNDQEYTVEPGQVFLVRPGEDNEMSLTTPGVGLKKVMQIAGPLVPTLLSLTGLADHDVVRPADLPWLTAQFERAHQTLQRPTVDSARVASAIAYEVIIELSRSVARSGVPPRLRKAVDYMKTHPGDHLTVPRLCEMTKLSPSTLHRLFLEHFSMAPIAYFLNLKMQVAQSLLAGSHHPIKSIADQLGYASQLYFSAEFKKRVGMSPRTYRDKMRFGTDRPTGGKPIAGALE
ncbi:MAG TPA: AraC family transcriptional regulator [Tepidisphaeraceae bacterium]|jgi:AraC-like DNA-binding protein|nr:AraC family transcriptional regulator [Tepidisphaeraceae bacterium]